MNKEEKRKMKTLELNSKEDFQYYLYQLICRSCQSIIRIKADELVINICDSG